MPSKSAAQAKLMRAVAHGMKPHKGGPSKKVAKEYMMADQLRKPRFGNPHKVSASNVGGGSVGGGT